MSTSRRTLLAASAAPAAIPATLASPTFASAGDTELLRLVDECLAAHKEWDRIGALVVTSAVSYTHLTLPTILRV